MNNLNGNRKNEFRRKQEEKQRKLALKIEDEAGELREGSLKSEEAIPWSWLVSIGRWRAAISILALVL